MHAYSINLARGFHAEAVEHSKNHETFARILA